MTRVEIRTKFAEISGRYDLVTDYWGDDFTDNGADYFIDNGQRWLERNTNVKRSESSVFDELVIGAYYMTFQTARSIKEVWANNGETRHRLEKYQMADFKNEYSGLISEITQDAPAIYTPARLRAVDDTDMDSLGSFMNYTMDDSHDYNGILFGPPLDEAYVFEVVGIYYIPALTSESDENWWSTQHPDMLINAAMRQLEASYRNTEGVKDWDNVIMPDLMNIDKDIVDEEISEIEELEG